jgi:hypothetical protein
MSTDRGSSGSGWIPTSSSSSTSNSPFKLKFWSRPKDVALDAAMAEQTVRRAQPHLLHAHERIEYAFGLRSSGSHQSFFTSHRILVQYAKGMPGTTKRQRFTSLPYASISAWSLEITTSNNNNNNNNSSNNDSWKGDLDLKVWSSTGMAGGLLVVDLAATSGTELFALQHYLNDKCLLHTLLRPNKSTLVTASRNESEEQPGIEISAAHSSNATHESQSQTTMPILQSRMDLVHWLGKNNALAITNDTASLQFMRHVPVLASWSSSPPQQEELVVLAWGAAGGRGCTLLTNARILTITLSSTGFLDRHHSKLSFASWPWRSVGGWKSCSSGALLDTADTLWTLYTTVAEHPILALGVPLPLPDGLPGRDIESCLARALLAAAAAADGGSAPRVVGPNDQSPLAAATATDTSSSGPCSPKTNAWWFEESTNHKPLPATELNAHYHDVVPLLLPMETVELAFRGRYVFV